MSARTTIEWATNLDGERGVTWNPVTGCRKISPGCANCYAERIADRFWGARKFTEVRLHHDRIEQPLRFKKPQTIFVNSMSDLFHQEVPDEFIDLVFAVMDEASQHTFIILTKRHERMLEWATHPERRYRIALARNELRRHQPAIITYPHWPLPNVWLGVSVEDQRRADERREALKQTPAAARIVSYEPALGDVDWSGWEFLDWLICGYESGPAARPGHPAWARQARDFCQTHSIPFFFKQWGEFTPYAEIAFSHPWRPAPPRVIVHPSGSVTACRNLDVADSPAVMMYRVGKRQAGRLLDGREWNEMPARR